MFGSLTFPSTPTKESLEAYERISKLGEGTFGIVFKALQRQSGKFVAIKKIKLDHEDNGISATSLREICVLKELKHENIVNLNEIMFQGHNLELVFEFMDFDLRRFMERAELSEQMVRSLMYQLLSGMNHCHSRRIMHRDLKPQNILIDRNGNLKIADFGLARCFGVPMRAYTHEVVTLWYRAPEVLLGVDVYGIGVDLWSIGCIFGEMMGKAPMFTGDSEIGQLFKIFKVMGTPTTEYEELADWSAYFPKWKKQKFYISNASALDLLEKFLLYNPAARISCKKALHHSFFM